MINSRNNTLRASMLLCLLLTFFLAIPALAGGQDGKVDKTTDKARTKLEKKATPDWKDYCKSAQMCVRKNTNMEEAHSWLEKSIEMDKNPDNLEAMGDYHLANNEKRKAADFYLESLKAGILKNPNYQDESLQKKLTQLQKDLS
ncbi:hypothetical protein AB9P05_23335 [Roseivirga sp. BDSF3-8]|uniref:hypothetical protein n=1 Tax=Roseivirga sp. BDSF3-8 TaxID=3241598 RepID=UPI003532088D